MDNFCYKCGSKLNEQGLCPNCDIVKSSKNKGIIISIVIMFIVILIAIVAYFALKNDIIPINGKKDISVVQSTSQNFATQNSDNVSGSSTSNIGSAEKTSTTEKSAAPKSENTAITNEDNNYLFPSDKELLTESYLDSKSKNEIDLIRNEIYARHGYIFKMEQYYNYFIQKSWYKPTEPDMEKAYDDFNSIEKQNIEILVEYQNLG